MQGDDGEVDHLLSSLPKLSIFRLSIWEEPCMVQGTPRYSNHVGCGKILVCSGFWGICEASTPLATRWRIWYPREGAFFPEVIRFFLCFRITEASGYGLMAQLRVELMTMVAGAHQNVEVVLIGTTYHLSEVGFPFPLYIICSCTSTSYF
jgi:hypothetical protein